MKKCKGNVHAGLVCALKDIVSFPVECLDKCNVAFRNSTPPSYILIKVDGPCVCSICKQIHTG